MPRKLITKNLLANSFNQVIGVGFPIIIQYYLIRHLRLEDIGYWAIINSAKTFVLLSVTFLNIYLIKVLAEEKGEEHVQSYLTNSFVITYLLVVLPLLGFLGYMLYTYKFLYQYILISSVPIITFPLGMDFYFQAKLKNDYLFYRKLFVRIIFMVFLFLLVKNESDFILYVCISSFSMSLEHVINFYLLRKYIIIRKIKKSVLKEIFRGAIGYLPFNLSYNALPAISIVAGAYFLEMKTLAVITILFKVVNLATTFISSTVMVLFPLKVKNMGNSNSVSFNDIKYLRYTFFVSLSAIIGLIVFQKLIFFIFLHNYNIPNLNIQFIVLSFYILIHAMYNYLVFNFYLIKNKTFFISMLNLLIIVIFFMEIAFSNWLHFKILFSLEVIVPPALILVFLIYKSGLNKRISVLKI